jgi:hypothetical protein
MAVLGALPLQDEALLRLGAELDEVRVALEVDAAERAGDVADRLRALRAPPI